MKALLLATALAFGGTAVAQDQTTPPPPPPPPAEAPMTPDAPPPPPAQPPAAPPAAPMPEPAAPMTPPPPGPPPAPAPMTPQTTTGEDPVGGYQPAGPALSGPVQPGQQVVIQPSASPSQAYPPPPPLDKYPVCKRGQYDNCIQRGGR